MARTEYQVTGMTCEHCERAVTAEVGRLPGVQVLEVSAPSGRLVVSGAAEPEDASVLAAVEEAGYTAVRV